MTMTPRPRSSRAEATLARLGEAYFATQHGYDPYNATLLGVDEFDGLTFDPSREASERTAQELAAIGREVSEIGTASLTSAERVDHGVLTALVEGARADAEHSLWAANASAKSYVSRQGLIFQAVPAMTVGSSGGRRTLPQQAVEDRRDPRRARPAVSGGGR